MEHLVSDRLKIRVLIVDDHPLLREGLAAVIQSQPDLQLVSHAASGTDAIRQFRLHQPDITLLDLRLPDRNGVDVALEIRSEFPDARIIILTTFQGDVEVQRALQAGARGYVLKSMPPSQLLQAIRQVHLGKKVIPPEVAANVAEHMGEEDLTDREVEVLQEVARGSRNRDIGKSLRISEETVKVHIKHLMDKLGAKDRTEAVTIALQRGIIVL